MGGYSWRHPFALACQKCLRQRVYSLDRLDIAEHRKRATDGIVKTGRTGPVRGRYNRPTTEVRHEACGHTWFTTHYSVNKR